MSTSPSRQGPRPGLRTARALVLVGVLGGLAGGLFACENALSRQRAAICRRAVPALVSGEAELKVLRAGNGPAPDSARVDYVVGTRPHSALCRFNGGTELVGLSTDGSALNGASLYFLKRYYLDTSDSASR